MKTSSRNQFSGTIQEIKSTGITSEVVVALAGGHQLVATITQESCAELDLQIGKPVMALVKASQIVIATDLDNVRLSARNQLRGLITHVERGAVNSVVSLDLGEGLNLTAGVTLHSTEQLDLNPGQYATAIFKASSVILGVLA